MIKYLKELEDKNIIDFIYHFIKIINYNYLKIIVSLAFNQSKIYYHGKSQTHA